MGAAAPGWVIRTGLQQAARQRRTAVEACAPVLSLGVEDLAMV